MPTDLKTHNIVFTHPNIAESLVITTGANRISWAYNLVTQAYPTYAGEVVQVLSVNIDNLEITGDVRSYKEMEKIYRWFLLYLQKATQGNNQDAYVSQPVKMEYPHRGWTLFIKPIALPGMRYGRDVVIPTWTMTAHVEDPDPEQRALTIDHAINGDVENFKARVSANIGFRQANPFSDPLAIITKDEDSLYPKAKDIKGIKVQGGGGTWEGAQAAQLTGLAKQMNSMFEALSGGSSSSDSVALATDGSGPTTGSRGDSESSTSTTSNTPTTP
jgi:hypothetical protein